MKLRLVLLLLVSGACRGLEKRWTANVDWDRASNWLNDRTPGEDSLVVFPLEMRHAVGLPRGPVELRLAGMELPLDGIVALPENGEIAVSSKRASRVSHWLRETPFFWVDPENWRVESQAVPHLERLPCQADVVVLPASSRTFSAKLPVSRDVEVQAVRLEDENSTMARWEWTAMRDGDEFLGSRFSVKYSPLTGCESCPCQEGELDEYWEEICNVQRPRCGLPGCEYPLKVEGHCCPYCGGRVQLSKKTVVSGAARIAGAILRAYEGSLDWHARRTSDGYGEILLTEKPVYKGSDSILGVNDLLTAFNEANIEVTFSETSGGPLYDYRLAVALGPLLGCFIVLVLLVALVFPAFGYTYSQVWDAMRELGSAICTDRRVNGRKRKSFAFARFENLFEGNVQLAEEEEVDGDSNKRRSSGGERFENPLYRHDKAASKRLDTGEPVSLVQLEKAIELDQTEEIEMDIENL